MKTTSSAQGSAWLRLGLKLKFLSVFVLLGLAFTSPSRAAVLVANPSIGVRLASGFQITQFANETLADDIYAMTLDPRGRVVVTGPGYIRTLIDSDGDGIADTQKLFAVSKTGGMGLCFDGPYLYFVGDGGLWRYVDQDGDGVADGPPISIMPIKFAEHGGHAIRQGPDGSWFLMAGNDADIHPGLITSPRTPVRAPEAGMLLRFPADFGNSSVYAHGFRNAYDFDFGALGDLFTYDSDVERDYLLPWYTPTRLSHIGYSGHHGWRLPGFTRSFNRPSYSPGTTPILQSMGRGSPTGVVCYRHGQFPPRYHNGLFLLDWTFGRVLFANVEPSESSFRCESEIFLDPIGTAGFAPTDAVVTPDGSLLVSIGGRRTRGAVYRIQYTAELSRSVLASNWVQLAATEVDAVLRAPQPLDAWSRAFWKPLAQRLGSRPFDLAAGSENLPDGPRIRAIEILTELHGGMPTGVANSASRSVSPFVRARTAWSLGRLPCVGFSPYLGRLAQDVSPYVRRCALEALSEQVELAEAATVAQAAVVNAGHSDKRLQQLSARLAGFLPLTNWQSYFQSLARSTPQARLTCALAVAWRYPTNGVQPGVIDLALGALKLTAAPSEQLEALGLITMGLGDWQIVSPSVELYSAYESVGTLENTHPLSRQIREAIRPLLLSHDPTLRLETARILGMLRDPEPSLAGTLLSQITMNSLASDDFHFLSVLSRLRSSGSQTNQSDRIAAALLGINRKLGNGGMRPKQNWSDRFRELAEQLIQRSPALPEAILKLPGFASESNLGLSDAFDFHYRQQAARVFLKLAAQDRNLRGSVPLIRLLGLLPSQETRSVFRAQWQRIELRDELVLVLAPAPQAEDRDKFVSGLASVQPEVVNASITALIRLPRDGAPASLDVSLRLLQRALRDKKPTIRAAQVVGLINHLTGQSFQAPDPEADLATGRRLCQPLFDWCSARYPVVAAGVGREAESAATFEKALQSTRWDKGNPVQGAQLYQVRGCGACHGGGANIAPDLLGVTRRWSPRDLFLQIKYPSKEVAEQYRATSIQTRQGASYLGLVSFYSADGVILRTADGRTVRVAQEDIASQRASTDSIMPEGLLEGLRPADLADFYAYLRTLDQPRAP